MKSHELADGPVPEMPNQEDIDKWANRTAWKVILGGIGLVAIYNVSRAFANNFNDAMGGSPSDFRRKKDS